jgi:hypothetical protein
MSTFVATLAWVMRRYKVEIKRKSLLAFENFGGHNYNSSTAT